MQRIFKYGDIPKTILTPDKELNILIYQGYRPTIPKIRYSGYCYG